LSLTELTNQESLMLLTIILTLSVLVGINFLLLIFSCNKTTKREVSIERKPTFVVTKHPTTTQASTQLAPTGS
jgi:hypothetical protein